jgi:predicted metal-dependent hydrolase
MVLRTSDIHEHKKQAVVHDWYLAQLREAASSLVRKWEPRMNLKVERIFLQRMKTKWGSCNPTSKSIRLNTELAKKPLECLEYIVVHEMVHLLVRRHNDQFMKLMGRYLPGWRVVRRTLNEAPLAHVEWSY